MPQKSPRDDKRQPQESSNPLSPLLHQSSFIVLLPADGIIDKNKCAFKALSIII